MSRQRYFVEWRLRPEHHAKGHLPALRGWCRYRAYPTAEQRDHALAALQAAASLFDYRAETAA
jgi:hypothetical protein